MNKLILGLGGNKGDVLSSFSRAEQYIKDEIGSIAKSSSIYQTAAWGQTNQPDFLNNVIVVNTNLTVEECLAFVLEIEQKLGRVRTDKKWGQRIIDIDILFYNDLVVDQENLIVPHPYIQDRNFVLIPLAEVVPNYMHPNLKKTSLELLERCTDKLLIKKLLKSE